MIKLVKGKDNVIDFNIEATYPVGELYGTFIANTVSIAIPVSRYGTQFTITASQVAAIGYDEMIAVVKLYDADDNLFTTLRVPLELLPENSSNDGYTTIRATLVYIRAVEGEGHCGAAVKMYDTYASLPQPGNAKYVYLVKDANKMYRWNEDLTTTDKYMEVSKEVAVTNGTTPTEGERMWVDESEVPEPAVLQTHFSGIDELQNASLNTVSEKVNTILKRLQGR